MGLGAVALQHPDLAAEQMEYGVKKLGMRGFEIEGSVNGEDYLRRSSIRFGPRPRNSAFSFLFILPVSPKDASAFRATDF